MEVPGDFTCPPGGGGSSFYGPLLGCGCPPSSIQGASGACVDTTSLVGTRYLQEETIPPVKQADSFSLENVGLENFFAYLTLGLCIAVFAFCTLLRCAPLHGRWLEMRFAISRFDRRFSKRHWYDESKVNVKRRTELGGMLTIVSWIFFIGLSLSIILNYMLGVNTTTDAIDLLTMEELNDKPLTYMISIDFWGTARCDQLKVQDVFNINQDGFNGTADPADIDNNGDNTQGTVSVVCDDESTDPSLVSRVRVNMTCLSCTGISSTYLQRFAFEDKVPPGGGQPDWRSPVVFSAIEYTMCVNATVGQLDSCVTSLIRPDVRSAAMRGYRESGEDELYDCSSALVNGILLEIDRGTGDAPYTFMLAEANVDPGGQITKASQLSPKDKVAGGPIAPAGFSYGKGAGACFEVTLSSQRSWILRRRIHNLNQSFVTFMSKVGGIYSLSLSLFMWLLIQSELRVKTLRYDLDLLEAVREKRLKEEAEKQDAQQRKISGIVYEEYLIVKVQALVRGFLTRLKAAREKTKEREEEERRARERSSVDSDAPSPRWGCNSRSQTLLRLRHKHLAAEDRLNEIEADIEELRMRVESSIGPEVLPGASGGATLRQLERQIQFRVGELASILNAILLPHGHVPVVKSVRVDLKNPISSTAYTLHGCQLKKLKTRQKGGKKGKMKKNFQEMSSRSLSTAIRNQNKSNGRFDYAEKGTSSPINPIAPPPAGAGRDDGGGGEPAAAASCANFIDKSPEAGGDNRV
mmetsp:Transcript_33903/g.107703  ORF Transcript_33903/g.107703 Transcript_33903/m.107703 type:complete len:750 (+) Transcript_33903:92-2341(+)